MNAALFNALVTLADPVPADEDVKAGWPALLLFLGLAACVVLLVWSMTRHLKKTKANADHGAFGDEPSDGSADPQD